jgi:hypothetical protein
VANREDSSITRLSSTLIAEEGTKMEDSSKETPALGNISYDDCDRDFSDVPMQSL